TETGMAHLLRHVTVDDSGKIANPLLAEGLIHGGIAQGVAQALYEEMAYDEDGNCLAGSLTSYALPTAAELPMFETARTETPSPLNPLGAKGIGESGAIGATPAVWNAVVDAISYLGVDHVDMPATPQRVWTAIQKAKEGARACGVTPCGGRGPARRAPDGEDQAAEQHEQDRGRQIDGAFRSVQ